jgi:hypothetical protein
MVIDSSQNTTFTGNVAMPASGGIDYSANTGAAGEASSLLDWYEEGTWTPMVTDGTNNATMDNAWGYYTRVGNIIHCKCWFNVSSLGSVSGGLFISGLPFVSANDNGAHQAGTAGWGSNLAITAGTNVLPRMDKGQSTWTLGIWAATTGVTNMTHTQMTANGNLVMSLTYSI